MRLTKHLATTALALGLATGAAAAHPLDGLTAEEYQKINQILREQKVADDDTLYPLIELKEPAKAEVLAWKEGDSLDRKATVYFTSADGFNEAVVNISKGTVESNGKTAGQPMVLFTEFMGALEGALGHPDMVAGLAKRGLKPEQAFCLPLTGGNFFTEEYRLNHLIHHFPK